MTGALVLAFAAGTVATVNPCGFALLPAYLGRRLAAEGGERARGRAVAGALLVGAATTGGFVVVFALVGTGIALGARFLTAALPWAGLAIGLALAAAGLAVLAGKHIGIRLPLPGGHARPGLRGDLVFGIGYGTASLSCALPVFLVATGTALTGGLAVSVLAFCAYAAGMGAVLTALALAAALAREGLARTLRRTLPYVERASGALLVLAGGYVVYYWAFALRGGARGPIDAGAAVSSRLGGWLAAADAQLAAAVLVAALATLVLATLMWRLWLRRLSNVRVGWVVGALLVPAALSGAAFALADRGGVRAPLERSQLRGFLEPSVAAPPFALTDQNRRVVQLAALRGRPVVLAFVYSHCREICPLTAERIRSAQRLLSADSGKVAWLAVSVDPRSDTAASVRAFSRRHGLLGRWRYLFRPRRRVLATLKAYGIQPQLTEQSSVQAPFQQHGAYISLLDGAGRRVESFTGQTLTAVDLAHDLRLLLASSGLAPQSLSIPPAKPRAVVSGKARPVPLSRPQASLRGGVLSLSGSDLASGRPIRLDAYRGKPVVVNVWASWCAGCAAEAPALAAFARAHPEAELIGVDVEDTQSAGRAFVRRFALPYPSVFDAAGATTIALEVKGLPTTIFLDRDHRVVTRIVGESDRAGFERGLRGAERGQP